MNMNYLSFYVYYVRASPGLGSGGMEIDKHDFYPYWACSLVGDRYKLKDSVMHAIALFKDKIIPVEIAAVLVSLASVVPEWATFSNDSWCVQIDKINLNHV